MRKAQTFTDDGYIKRFIVRVEFGKQRRKLKVFERFQFDLWVSVYKKLPFLLTDPKFFGANIY